MVPLERTITVGVVVVWPFLADFCTTEEWDPATVSTLRTSGEGGVGSTYRNVSKFRGRRIEVDYVVTESVARERLVLVGTSTTLRLVRTLTLRATSDGGTQVTGCAQLAGRGPGDVVAAPVLPALAELVGLAAESLEDSLIHLRP